MKSLKDIISLKSTQKNTRNSYEYQAYGNRLAEEFSDTKRRALYIKLAKNEDRELLEMAREFVLSQPHIQTKGKLFMWKLSKMKEEKSNLNKKE